MPFTVEDGTGVEGANSYVSAEYAADYFALRNKTDWPAIPANLTQVQGLLIEATDYIEAIFARRFIGEMTDPAQPLSWPRSDTDDYLEVAYADNVIPDVLKRACCQYAYQALVGGPLMPTPELQASGFAVVTTREAVGPIETEYRAVGTKGRPTLIRAYPAADSLMASLLVPTNASVIR